MIIHFTLLVVGFKQCISYITRVEFLQIGINLTNDILIILDLYGDVKFGSETYYNIAGGTKHTLLAYIKSINSNEELNMIFVKDLSMVFETKQHLYHILSHRDQMIKDHRVIKISILNPLYHQAYGQLLDKSKIALVTTDIDNNIMTTNQTYQQYIHDFDHDNIHLNNGVLNFQLHNPLEEMVVHEVHDTHGTLHTIEIKTHSLPQYVQTMPFGLVILDMHLNILSWNNVMNLQLNMDINSICIPEEQKTFTHYLMSLVNGQESNSELFSLIPNVFIEDNITNTKRRVKIYGKYTGNYIVIFITCYEFEAYNQDAYNNRLHMLGELVTAVAHDFNNIICTLNLLADSIVKRNLFISKSPDYLDLLKIKNMTYVANELVEHLLAFAQIQEPENTLIDMNEYLDDFGHVFSKTIPNITIITKSAKKKILIYSNRVYLSQILMNLIFNAKDAMPTGGQIHITLDRHILSEDTAVNNNFIRAGEYLKLEIVDTGVGMESEDLQNIFKFQFSKKQAIEHGFGLSIVKKAVDKVGGYIEIQSIRGQGTKFQIYIPLTLPPVQEAAQPIGNPTIMQPKNILCLEDDINIMTCIKNSLEDQGFRVYTSEHVTDIYDTLIKNNIEIILLDISIYGDVNSFVHRVMNNYPNIKIIFVSGHMKEYIEQLFQISNIHFLGKPFSTQDLLCRLRE